MPCPASGGTNMHQFWLADIYGALLTVTNDTAPCSFGALTAIIMPFMTYNAFHHSLTECCHTPNLCQSNGILQLMRRRQLALQEVVMLLSDPIALKTTGRGTLLPPSPLPFPDVLLCSSSFDPRENDTKLFYQKILHCKLEKIPKPLVLYMRWVNTIC